MEIHRNIRSLPTEAIGFKIEDKVMKAYTTTTQLLIRYYFDIRENIEIRSDCIYVSDFVILDKKKKLNLRLKNISQYYTIDNPDDFNVYYIDDNYYYIDYINCKGINVGDFTYNDWLVKRILE